jgi:hypothetical protein
MTDGLFAIIIICVTVGFVLGEIRYFGIWTSIGMGLRIVWEAAKGTVTWPLITIRKHIAIYILTKYIRALIKLMSDDWNADLIHDCSAKPDSFYAPYERLLYRVKVSKRLWESNQMNREPFTMLRLRQIRLWGALRNKLFVFYLT